MDTATLAAVAPIGALIIAGQVGLWYRLGRLEGLVQHLLRQEDRDQ